MSRVLLAALAALLLVPAAASAAPVTYTATANNGATHAITFTSTSVIAGGALSVSGSGYTDGQYVIFKLDDAAGSLSGTAGGSSVAPTQFNGWPTFVVGSDGTFSGTLTLPSTVTTAGGTSSTYPDADHWYRALAGSQPQPAPSGGWPISSIQAWFHLADETVDVSAPSVAPGATITATIAGFGAGQDVALMLDGTTQLACLTANGSGSVTIPAGTTEGAHTIVAQAGYGCPAGGSITDPPAASASTTLEVSDDPAVTLSAPSVVQGGAVTASGVRFPAGSVAVTLDGAPLTTVTAAGDGTFSQSLTIPSATSAGSHTLAFTNGAAAASVPLAVTAASSGGGSSTPVATISTPTVAPGAAVGFALTGFVADGGGGQLVAVRLDDTRDVLACVTTDAAGNGSGAITLPAGAAAGAHSLRFLAGTSCVSGGPVNNGPSRSLLASFTVADPNGAATTTAPDAATGTTPGATTTGATPTTAPNAATTASAKLGGFAKLTLRNGRIGLRITLPSAGHGTIGVRTTGKVKVGKRKQLLTVVATRAWTFKAGTHTLTLKPTGLARQVLKRTGKLRVRVALKTDGGKTVTKVVTLR